MNLDHPGTIFPLRAGAITNDQPVYFQSALPADCGGPATGCRVRGQSPRLAGDNVVVIRAVPGFVCAQALTPDPAGRYPIGWLPSNRVKIDPSQDRSPASAAWLGTWRKKTAAIVIRAAAAQKLHARGQASWPGRGMPHFGSLDKTFAAGPNPVTLGDEKAPNTCVVLLLLIGDHLAAMDNARCGGDNVSFSGIYQRGRR